MSSGEIKELDVRPDLRAGKEPFRKIMAAAGELTGNDQLHILAPFRPDPLLKVLGNKGFQVSCEQDADLDQTWRVKVRQGAGDGGGENLANEQDLGNSQVSEGPVGAADQLEEGIYFLDNRGLVPPQPMQRTLETLQQLAPADTLVIHNDRRPAFLYPQLEELGFEHHTVDQPDGSAKVTISRKDEGSTMDNKTLDLRDIAPAKRHPLIFDTFHKLEPGESFTLINDHDPKPLYYQFSAEYEGQFSWEYTEEGPTSWRVKIGKL